MSSRVMVSLGDALLVFWAWEGILCRDKVLGRFIFVILQNVRAVP